MLARKTLKSALWSLPPGQLKIGIYCLLRANWEVRKIFRGDQLRVIEKGTFWTSLETIALECETTTNKVRTALKNLEKIGYLTDESTSQGRLITIVNYPFYQEQKNYETPKDDENNRGVTGVPQTVHKPPTDGTQTVHKPFTANKKLISEEGKEGKNKKTDPALTELFDDEAPVTIAWLDVVQECHPLTCRALFNRWRGAVEDLQKIGRPTEEIISRIRNLPANSNPWDLTKLYQPGGKTGKAASSEPLPSYYIPVGTPEEEAAKLAAKRREWLEEEAWEENIVRDRERERGK